MAAAEEIFNILKDFHEATTPHKNYRNTYFDVSNKSTYCDFINYGVWQNVVQCIRLVLGWLLSE